ncbi:MAG: hypothetical protein KatS3mg082_0748 [Nitrospiraceae bacterium]|nr:MAG: hypothetical protein KatS3mg082_0748 [Nitrospiraceae bacterium]
MCTLEASTRTLCESENPADRRARHSIKNPRGLSSKRKAVEAERLAAAADSAATLRIP